MTLREWLRKGEQQLDASPHADRARPDTETLLLHLVGKNRAWLMAHLDDDFAGCAAIRFAGLLDRRLRGEPIQYIVGETEFFGLPFRVTPDVLIPRPETEHLVEKAIELARRRAAPRIVDLCTGSGAIAVALAHALAATQVTATDLSHAALAVAQENALRNRVESRIRFLEGDLFEPVAGERFDLAVANPPYVPTSEGQSMSVEVRDHEPALALFAGVDGLDIYRRLIAAAPAVLVPGGYIVLEIGYGQAQAVDGLLVEAGFRRIEFVPDLQGIPRVACAERP